MNRLMKSNNILINSFTNTKHEDMFIDLIEKIKNNSDKSLNDSWLKTGDAGIYLYNTGYNLDRHANTSAFGEISWGIKNINGKLEWEMYFYRQVTDIKKSMSIIKEIFPNLPTSLPESTERQVDMWSININDLSPKEINLYSCTSHPNEKVFSAAKTFAYDGTNYKYQNDYLSWLTANRQDYVASDLQAIKEEILPSPFINNNQSEIHNTIDMDNILLPEFLKATAITTCTKKDCESIYYQALEIDLLIIFLKKFNYPQKQIDFLENNKKKLSHLVYCVSFDYKIENNKFKILKSGYYGQL